jgi:cytochrome b involved in lipid metabolism
MPFENQSFNEQPIQSKPEVKSNKLIVILIILILLAGAYLAYSLYSTNQADDTNTVDLVNPISQESDTNPVNDSDAVTQVDNTSPVDKNTNSKQVYTIAQVAENNNKSSCWTIIDGNVYNITSYIPNHPGGESEILQICGKDGTNLFNKPSEHISGGAKNILDAFKVGIISP